MKAADERPLELSLSSSKIDAAECWHYFRKEVIEGERSYQDTPDTAQNLLIGRMAHRITEKYTESLLRMKIPSDHGLYEEIFEAVWSETNVYLPESAYRTLKKIMADFAESFALDIDNVWGCEIPISLGWNLEKLDWEEPAAWLRGKLDRVDIYPNEAIITDYKTSYRIPPEKELREGMQARIYPFLLYCMNRALKQFTVVFHYIRWNKKIMVEFSINDVMAVEEELRLFTHRLAARMNKSDAEWPAIRGSICAICRHKCPLLEYDIEPIQSMEKAQVLAMQIEALQDQVQGAKRLLKEYAQGADTSVIIPTGTWESVPVTTYRGLKAADVADICLLEGVDLNRVMKADTEKIRKLDDEALRKQILGMAKRSDSTRFQFTRKKEETPQGNDDESGS